MPSALRRAAKNPKAGQNLEHPHLSTICAFTSLLVGVPLTPGPTSTRPTCLLPPEHTSHLSSLNCLAKAVLCSPPASLGLLLVREGPLTAPSRCTFSFPQNSGDIVIHLIVLFPPSYDSLIILLDQFLCPTEDASRFCFSQMLNIIKLFIRSD